MVHFGADIFQGELMIYKLGGVLDVFFSRFSAQIERVGVNLLLLFGQWSLEYQSYIIGKYFLLIFGSVHVPNCKVQPRSAATCTGAGCVAASQNAGKMWFGGYFEYQSFELMCTNKDIEYIVVNIPLFFHM